MFKENRFYIYIHERKDNEEIFYVGRGTGNRDKSKTTRNKDWHEVVKHSCGYNSYRLHTDLTEQEALDLENIYLEKLSKSCKLVNKRKRNHTPHQILEEDCDWFEYDESSPTALVWKKSNLAKSPTKKRYSGDVAGYLNTNPEHAKLKKAYYTVKVNGKALLVHRLVWVMCKGTIPEGMVINHRNGNSLDNRISNLEAIPQSVNSRRTIVQDNENCGVTECIVNNIYYFAKAIWTGYDGKRITKFFPYIEYGKEEAHRLAKKARKEALLELNKRGAGYIINDNL